MTHPSMTSIVVPVGRGGCDPPDIARLVPEPGSPHDEFADIYLEDYPSPVRLIIELIDQTPLADDWFTRQTHHSQDAEVHDVSDEQLFQDAAAE